MLSTSILHALEEPQAAADELVEPQGAPARASPPDPQAALLDRLSDDELLDILGPSWAAMSPAERAAYGPPRASGHAGEPVSSLLTRYSAARKRIMAQGAARG